MAHRYTLAELKDGTGFAPDALFEQVEDYNGWTNRETWAVALYINNDQGWQQSVYEALREMDTDPPRGADDYDGYDHARVLANRAGDVIRANVEATLSGEEFDNYREALPTLRDIGSLWRVEWAEIGASFLSALDES